MNTIKTICCYIRQLTPCALKRLLRRLGSFMTDEMLETKQFPDIKSTLLILKHHDFNPRICVDIGAYKGEWTLLWKHVFPSTSVLMIEPQQDKATILQGICDKLPGKVFFESVLLGSEDQKDVTFYVMETGSSVLPELTDFPRTTTILKTTTLDITLNNLGITESDFIKLDAQGYEIEILKGATKTLAKTSAILIEASLIPYNKGGPLILEVIQFCDQLGFQLFDICSDMRREDYILRQTDLLFIRRGSSLFKLLNI